MDELMVRLANEVVGQMNSHLYSAVEGLEREAAVTALFRAYRDYVHSAPELYRLVIRLPQSSNQEVAKIAEQITGPVVRVLEGYKLSDEQIVHCQRYLRSLLHGFSALEQKGYLSHWEPPTDVSYSFIAGTAADYLRDLENSGGHKVEK